MSPLLAQRTGAKAPHPRAGTIRSIGPFQQPTAGGDCCGANLNQPWNEACFTLSAPFAERVGGKLRIRETPPCVGSRSHLLDRRTVITYLTQSLSSASTPGHDRKALEILSAVCAPQIVHLDRPALSLPVLIEQYPEYFKDNRWILPICLLVSNCSAVSWITINMPPFFRWAARRIGGSRPVMAWTLVVICGATLLVRGRDLLAGYWSDRKHERHRGIRNRPEPPPLPLAIPEEPQLPPLTGPSVQQRKPESLMHHTQPSVTFGAYLQPDEPYIDGTLLAGIVWQRPVIAQMASRFQISD